MRNRSILPLLLAGLVVLALFALGGTGFLGAYANEDAMKSIIDSDFVPSARAGDIEGAVLNTVEAVAERVTPERRDRLEMLRVVNAGLGLIGAPLALLDRRIARVWAINTLLMHWGILAIMGIVFWYHRYGLPFLSFFALERLLPKTWRKAASLETEPQSQSQAQERSSAIAS